MREAPSLVIIDILLKEGANIKAYDPVAMEEAERKLGSSVEFCANKYDAIKDSDALIVIIEWSEFRIPDYLKMSQLMKESVIFDGRNIYEPAEMQENGFAYYSIGRKPIMPNI